MKRLWEDSVPILFFPIVKLKSEFLFECFQISNAQLSLFFALYIKKYTIVVLPDMQHTVSILHAVHLERSH